MQENHQKIKLLKLMELLKQETDELHPFSTSEICSRLGAMGISCERRTLAKDIALLNEQGFEVMWCKVGKEKGYYIEDRSFSVPELKILIDAVQAAKARKADVLLCDTAGRLHNKKNLMEELKKINRILEKEYPEAYRETLVVLDATTGQNALVQAREFGETADLTGIILTKMDGTAKGGIAVAIHSELGIPVKYIGVGESIDDLQKFDADQFVDALFEKEDVNE